MPDYTDKIDAFAYERVGDWWKSVYAGSIPVASLQGITYRKRFCWPRGHTVAITWTVITIPEDVTKRIFQWVPTASCPIKGQAVIVISIVHAEMHG